MAQLCSHTFLGLKGFCMSTNICSDGFGLLCALCMYVLVTSFKRLDQIGGALKARMEHPLTSDYPDVALGI